MGYTGSLEMQTKLILLKLEPFKGRDQTMKKKSSEN